MASEHHSRGSYYVLALGLEKESGWGLHAYPVHPPHQGAPRFPNCKWATVCTQPCPYRVVVRVRGRKCQGKENAPKCYCLQFLDSCSCQLLGVGQPLGLGQAEREAMQGKKAEGVWIPGPPQL